MKELLRKRFLLKTKEYLYQVNQENTFELKHAVSIENTNQLLELSPGLLRNISCEFNAQSLATRLCPVLMQDHSVAIFALQDFVAGDQANELVKRILHKGYLLSNQPRYIVQAPLLSAIARNQWKIAIDENNTKNIHQSKTVLTQIFQDLIEWGVRNKASDLHININTNLTESEIKYTISGRYVAPERFNNMATNLLMDMLSVVWMDIKGGNGVIFDPFVEQQGSLIKKVDKNDVVIRWASLAADYGPSVCLRLLVRNISFQNNSLQNLGYLPDQIETINRVATSSGGAIVFAGTVGSGKSTTLATLIANLPTDRKVITIEDPVEYRIPNAIQNTIARTLDEESPMAYAAKLRTLKRSAMSDVLLGEIRDIESGRAFMDLAGSGVNIYTTVHASCASSVPDRLCSDFIGVSKDFLLSSSVLRLIVYQSLIGKICPNCSLPISTLLNGYTDIYGVKKTGRFWGAWLDQIQNLYSVDITTMRIRNQQGCACCGIGQLKELKGYVGRTVAAEIIEPNLHWDFLNNVRHNSTNDWLLEKINQYSKGTSIVDIEWRTAMDSAVIKALDSQVDPRDIEHSFQSYKTISYMVKPKSFKRLAVV